MKEWLVFSVGGGTIMEHYQERKGAQAIYQLNSMDEIKNGVKIIKKSYGNML